MQHLHQSKTQTGILTLILTGILTSILIFKYAT